MSQRAPEYPEIDFATDEVPNLHEVLEDLRERYAVAPVQYHGGLAYLITRYNDVHAAFSDDETFPSAAAYKRHSGPVMGKTIQCMGGAEHKRNRGLVAKAFRPKLMTEFVEAFLTPVAHELVDQFAGDGVARGGNHHEQPHQVERAYRDQPRPAVYRPDADDCYHG